MFRSTFIVICLTLKIVDSDSASVVMARLVEIDDELRGLADFAFAEKHALNVERDELRAKLRELLGDDAKAAVDDWAERAGRKGAHKQNVERSIAMIFSPNGGS